MVNHTQNYTHFRSVRIRGCGTHYNTTGHPALGITPFSTANSVVRMARKEIYFFDSAAQLQSQHRWNWNKTLLQQDV
jgi:hypothetical protein